jgi:carboxymethylenebutenolidase
MERKMDPYITELYQSYLGNSLDRRSFLKKLIKLAGGSVAAVALLPLLENKFGRAQIIPRNDSRLNSGTIEYSVESVKIRAYQASLKGQTKLPGVIVIHENKGLQPHIEDVARRIALEGFLAIAPDALSPLGGTPANIDEARSNMRKLDPTTTVQNFVAALKYLKTHPLATGKVGCTGFCWGGAMTNRLAVLCPDLDAAVPFYGRQPSAEEVPRINASLLCHYGELDKRINAGIEVFEKALKAASTDYKLFIYPGAKHAFFNDSRPDRYNRKAAELAWKRTIEFFKEKLKLNTNTGLR